MAKRSKPEPSVFDETCSARHALELISGKWPMLILSALAVGPMRHGALMRRVGGVSQKMLTQTLRELERNGLITRQDHQCVPPHVEYELSALGRTLAGALIELDRWAEHNFPQLDAARERFDAARRRSKRRP